MATQLAQIPLPPWNQVLPYCLVVAGTLAALLLFLNLRREVRLQQFRWARRQRALQEEVARIRGALVELREALDETAHAGGGAPPPVQGMNVNRRAQALRLFRRGERPEQIAAALSLPQNEVELLLKVHQAAAN